MATSTIIALGRLQIPALGGHAWLAVILSHTMIVVAPAARARARPGTRAPRRSQARVTLFLDELPVLNKEDWSLYMALLLFFLK
jgi:hypothetical protein